MEAMVDDAVKEIRQLEELLTDRGHDIGDEFDADGEADADLDAQLRRAERRIERLERRLARSEARAAAAEAARGRFEAVLEAAGGYDEAVAAGVDSDDLDAAVEASEAVEEMLGLDRTGAEFGTPELDGENRRHAKLLNKAARQVAKAFPALREKAEELRAVAEVAVEQARPAALSLDREAFRAAFAALVFGQGARADGVAEAAAEMLQWALEGLLVNVFAHSAGLAQARGGTAGGGEGGVLPVDVAAAANAVVGATARPPAAALGDALDEAAGKALGEPDYDALMRLARRGGVARISVSAMEEAELALRRLFAEVCTTARVLMEHGSFMTVYPKHVRHALRVHGIPRVVGLASE